MFSLLFLFEPLLFQRILSQVTRTLLDVVHPLTCGDSRPRTDEDAVLSVDEGRAKDAAEENLKYLDGEHRAHHARHREAEQPSHRLFLSLLDIAALETFQPMVGRIRKERTPLIYQFPTALDDDRGQNRQRALPFSNGLVDELIHPVGKRRHRWGWVRLWVQAFFVSHDTLRLCD